MQLHWNIFMISSFTRDSKLYFQTILIYGTIVEWNLEENRGLTLKNRIVNKTTRIKCHLQLLQRKTGEVT